MSRLSWWSEYWRYENIMWLTVVWNLQMDIYSSNVCKLIWFSYISWWYFMWNENVNFCLNQCYRHFTIVLYTQNHLIEAKWGRHHLWPILSRQTFNIRFYYIFEFNNKCFLTIVLTKTNPNNNHKHSTSSNAANMKQHSTHQILNTRNSYMTNNGKKCSVSTTIHFTNNI